MKRKIDKLGRIVIPSEMRDELGLKNEDFADIEIKQEKIIIRSLETATIKNALEKVIEENKENGCVDISTLENILNR